MKIEFDWDRPIPEIALDKAGGSKGLLSLANEAAKFMDPYVPFDTGSLAQATVVYLEDEYAVIHYLHSYAHYQWVGEVYGPNIPQRDENGKIVGWKSPKKNKKTARRLKYKTLKHPSATSYWDEAMMAARKDDLIQFYENYLRRRG